MESRLWKVSGVIIYLIYFFSFSFFLLICVRILFPIANGRSNLKKKRKGKPLGVIKLTNYVLMSHNIVNQIFTKIARILAIHYLHNPIIHLFYPQKILHNHRLQVLLGHEDVLREIKNNAYANFWGLKRCIMGFVQVVNRWLVKQCNYNTFPRVLFSK